MNYSQGCRGNKNSHGISHVNGNGNHIYPMGILIVNPVGDPMENPVGDPMGNPVGDPMGNPVGNPMRNSMGSPVGMGYVLTQ